jgi:tyrosine-specific transport protein
MKKFISLSPILLLIACASFCFPLRLDIRSASSGTRKLQNLKCSRTLATKTDKDSSCLLDATFLVSGTTVGAGILALPEVAREPGFILSSVTLIACWIFMSTTGLLLAEVAANIQGKDTISDSKPSTLGILAMADITLGKNVAAVSGALYLFLHYTLLSAYVSEAGLIIDESFHLPPNVGSIIFTAISGTVLFFGSEKLVGLFNNISLGVVILAFLGLVSIGSTLFSAEHLFAYYDVKAVPKAVPIMFLALVFQNVVPVVSEKLNYDKKNITVALLMGTAIPLFMFLIWTALVLGIELPVDQETKNILKEDPVMLLRIKSDNPLLGPIISIFSEFAISTSFTGFVLGLVSFFKDIFPDRKEKDAFLFGLILVPPLIISCLEGSDMFISALDVAGTYGISLLFGVLPVLMTQRLRYENNCKISTLYT